MSQVRVKIDLMAGIIEVEAPSESYAEVFDKVSDVLPQLRAVHGASSGSTDESAEDEDAGGGSNDGKKKPTRRGGGSSKETYKVSDLGLKENDRLALRDFFKAKKPRAQHDQTAVLMSWLKTEKQKTQMVKDDVYTAFRTVDSKVPAKISSVLGNMVGMGWVKNVGNGAYELTHVGEDYVKFDLPPKKKAQ